jgi:hypothetical protein
VDHRSSTRAAACLANVIIAHVQPQGWVDARIKNNQFQVHAGNKSRLPVILQIDFKFVPSLSLAHSVKYSRISQLEWLVLFTFVRSCREISKASTQMSAHVFKMRNCSNRNWITFRPNIILFPVGAAEVELGKNERHGTG